VKRINLDRAGRAVRNFVSKLPIEHDGVELELNGQVICKVVPVLQYSDAEKKALIEERRKLIRQAQQRNRGVPARVIAQEIRQAVEQVRRKKQ
jgi:hypothetical protein